MLYVHNMIYSCCIISYRSNDNPIPLSNAAERFQESHRPGIERNRTEFRPIPFDSASMRFPESLSGIARNDSEYQ